MIECSMRKVLDRMSKISAISELAPVSEVEREWHPTESINVSYHKARRGSERFMAHGAGPLLVVQVRDFGGIWR
jgi:hypothetical protein